MSASAAAKLVYQTLGVATELDRALGSEANADGTSYLGPDPLRWLGTPVAAPFVTLTANRVTPGGLATTQWDDEGVAAQTFPLITEGVLVDYQTTREQAQWLAPWYATHGMPVQSRGCAIAETGLACPLQQSPNFVLSPGREAVSEADLIRDTAHGVYVAGDCQLLVDFQRRTGVLLGALRAIDQGTLGPLLENAAVQFTSAEFWQHVVALGGPATAETFLASQTKGQPSQTSLTNVTVVPLKVKDCAIVNAS